MDESMAPVITIDGPSGSGKGTLTQQLAQRLGWRLLDSGALYRLVAYQAAQRGLPIDDASRVAAVARTMNVKFEGSRVYLDGCDVADTIRTESVAELASRVAALPLVREALLDWQRRCAQPPGLVADGRDMGTIVFPQAVFKVFLDASPEERARRRYNQLIEKGFDASLEKLKAEVRARDQRDRNRRVAPLQPATDALIIDSTNLSAEQVLEAVTNAAKNALEV